MTEKNTEEPHKELQVKSGEVPCDVCLEPKLKAEKTCLVCLASYCQPHLEPHHRVKNLKKHKLTDPVVNLEDRVCKKHDKMFELYCQEDQVCVCFMCLKDDHMNHETVPLERAFKERKSLMENEISDMKLTENLKAKWIKKINYSVEQRKTNTQKEVTDVGEVLNNVAASLQRHQVKLVELIEEKQKEAEKQAEDDTKQLEQELTKLRTRRSEREQLLRNEDHLHFLQNTPNMYFPWDCEDRVHPLSYSMSFSQDYSDLNQSYVKMVKKAGAKMEKMLSKEMDALINEIKSSDGYNTDETDEFVESVWIPPKDKLMMIQQYDAVEVTLDATTANPNLNVHEDGKQLTYRKCFIVQQQYPTLFARRFANQPFVLAQDGFSSGRFYYEVEVSRSPHWVLGVARESINRHIFWLPSPSNGAWTISSKSNYFGEYVTDAEPQKVGVFVDYEKGEVTFYDAETRTVIYSYEECTFTEAVAPLKCLLYSLTGASISNRSKLYPIFGICGDNSHEVLYITPVSATVRSKE